MSMQDDLEHFLYHEAALLDEGRFKDWLDLFAHNGRYWVPLMGAAQAEGSTYNAIADEDRMMLQLRIERLQAGLAHSQQPKSAMQHVLQRPTQLTTESDDPTMARLRTPFVYAESRGDEVITLYGHYVHTLIRDNGRIQILQKRVNLVNASSRLPMIQLFP